MIKALLRKQLKRRHLILVILLIVVFHTELFTYVLNKYNWNEIKCEHEELCTKIILVADPQLIGKHNEVIHFLTPISIWDSDRYLHITYQQVFNFVKPNVVIFLGDLFDEGSISSDFDFQNYVTRLYNIFRIEQNSNIQFIWLPGDNDIGGEGMDVVTIKKIDKFNRSFPQPDIVQYNNITFYKINRLLHFIPMTNDNNKLFDININIGLSHVPILSSYSTFADEILQKLQPHVLFTAHEHKMKIVQLNVNQRSDRQIISRDMKTSERFKFLLRKNYVYEFLIPTCSYRMGTMNMGYGYAVIEHDTLQYTTLWSPTRFPTLFFYGVVLIILVLTILTKVFYMLIYCK